MSDNGENHLRSLSSARTGVRASHASAAPQSRTFAYLHTPWCVDCPECAKGDAEALREAMRALLLERAGFHAVEARNGWDAIGANRRACLAIALALLL